MSVDINWIQAVAALVLGFLLKVLFDELKYPRLRILSASKIPFSISPEIKAVANGIDNSYTAYRVRIENKQKRYLNCAAENCVAWLELDSAPEPYQICWVGNCSDVTINVGDVREVDFVARGEATGAVYSPTERGYFESTPRLLGDGKSELRGKLRISSRNGKKAERRFVIKPSNNQLEITFVDGNFKEIDMGSTNPDNAQAEDAIARLSTQIENSDKADWFRFFFGLGFAIIAIGLGILFSSSESLVNPMKSVLAAALLALGFFTIFQVGMKHRPRWFHKRIANAGFIILLFGVLAMLVETYLETEHIITIPHVIPVSMLIGTVGFILIVISFTFKKQG